MNPTDQASVESPAEAPTDLALVRTELANERTLLAYGRTALMMVATGVSLVEFLDVSPGLVVMGWLLIASGAIVGAIGTFRFTSLKHRLHSGQTSQGGRS